MIVERPAELDVHKEQDTAIKLDCVASDVLGASGRAMLDDTSFRGPTDPDVLADLAKDRRRAKIAALREALDGRLEPHNALVIGAILVWITGGVDGRVSWWRSISPGARPLSFQ